LQVKPHRKRQLQDRSFADKPPTINSQFVHQLSMQNTRPEFNSDADNIENLKKDISLYLIKEGMITS